MRAKHRRLRGGALSVLAAAVVLSACLLPDEKIRFLDSDLNEHAVRFVDGVPTTLTDRCACSESLGLDSCELVAETDPDDVGRRCPLPSPGLLPRFMDPAAFDGFDFCGCPEGENDAKALPTIDDIYLEDLDVDEDDNGDSLFAALLLDLPNDAFADASEYVAYRPLLNPDAVLPKFTNVSSVLPNAKLLARPDPQLYRVVLGNPSTNQVDFCNDAGTSARLSEGWHTATLIVTDRPWLTVSSSDPDSEVPDLVKQGVPDVAGHATWATRQWTFHCSDVENNTNCQCEAPL